MATAGDQIYAALRLIGQLAEGEVPSAATAQDALNAMDQMLDSWSTERLAVFSLMDQVFTWPSGVSTRTLGPSGNFVGTRPIKLETSTYYIDTNGLSHLPELINADQYNSIALKNIQAAYPSVLWANYKFPDIEMKIYPVPTGPYEWHFMSVIPLDQPASLSTVLSFPPGYKRAFKYNLAVEIANEFGVSVAPETARIAMASKRNLKRINNPDDVLFLPPNLIRTSRWGAFFYGY